MDECLIQKMPDGSRPKQVAISQGTAEALARCLTLFATTILQDDATWLIGSGMMSLDAAKGTFFKHFHVIFSFFLRPAYESLLYF